MERKRSIDLVVTNQLLSQRCPKKLPFILLNHLKSQKMESHSRQVNIRAKIIRESTNNLSCISFFFKKIHFIIGIAGVQISTSYLKKIFDENSPDDCSETGVYRCYLIDLSGYLLASNQPLSEVSPGDFLGQVDNQVESLSNILSRIQNKTSFHI